MFTRPTVLKPRTAPLLAALLCLIVLPALGQGREDIVTGEGFTDRMAESTFYMPVPMTGIMGEDCPPKAVKATLQAAADDKNIKHAVFMIDSEYGWPLENDDIGGFHNKLEITAVVRRALAPAIFPVFFADNIFIVDGGLVGNLPLVAFVGEGSEEVAAKQVGIYSSMLASAAQSRKHSAAIAYAMIDHNKKLYAWEENGKTQLSNTEPADKGSKTNYRRVRSALPSFVLTLDQKTAEEIGFAKPIDDFDHFIVGEYLKKPNWMPANNFGRVANEIGKVIAELEPLRETIREIDKQIPEIKTTRNSSTEEKGFRQFKKSLDEAVKQIDMINEALEGLYKLHPERHAYFTGPTGKTIVADPEQWEKDYNASRREVNRAAGILKRFTDDFKNLGGDAEYLYGINQQMQLITEHLNGIGRYGNAAYWKEHAKPDLPDDIYG